MKTSYSCCSRVPLLLLVALALCLGAAARAQVSDPGEVKSKPKPEGRKTITFTDRNGHRYEDVEVVTIEPDGIAYLEADRVHAGKVKFTDMTESDRTRLGYDPDRAVRHAQQQAEQERSRLATAQRASAARQLAAA